MLQKSPNPEPLNDIDRLASKLESDGAVVLSGLVPDSTLKDMQAAFASRLRHQRMNNVDGYQRTEPKRLLVEDVLTLAQGFVDIAVHPIIRGVLDKYIGATYSLCEAKGWQTLRSLKDFHGWHGDAWYDQHAIVDRIPREVKLAFYLSDVNSGAFQYLRGTHQRVAPHLVKRADVDSLPLDEIMEFKGAAGTAILFDTSGIHRQGIPVLEPRRAVFYNFHDPSIPLQAEDIEYYRYHPILLNAAFLGDLKQDQQRVLGFGNKQRLQADYVRPPRHPRLYRFFESLISSNIQMEHWSGRISGKLRRLFG